MYIFLISPVVDDIFCQQTNKADSNLHGKLLSKGVQCIVLKVCAGDDVELLTQNFSSMFAQSIFVFVLGWCVGHLEMGWLWVVISWRCRFSDHFLGLSLKSVRRILRFFVNDTDNIHTHTQTHAHIHTETLSFAFTFAFNAASTVKTHQYW